MAHNNSGSHDDQHRPNMTRAPVAFATVSSAVLGAAMGGAVSGVLAALEKGGTYRERLLSKSTAATVALTSIMWSAMGYVAAKTHNNTLDQVEPYVDRLEKQRDDAKATLKNGLNKLGG